MALIEQFITGTTTIFYPILSQSETSATLGLISTGLITSFVPLAIAILGSFDPGKKFLRKVGIIAVIDARYILGVFILLFVPLIFWTENNLLLNFVVLALWVTGFIASFFSFKNVYAWFTGKEHPFLIKYFNRSIKPEEMILDWKEYWDSDRYPEYDTDFFRVYNETIRNWLDSKNVEKAKKLPSLIETIIPYIQTGNIFTLTREDSVLGELLKIRLKVWEMEINAFFTEPIDSVRASYLSMAVEGIDAVTSDILKRVLTEYHSFSYFHTLEMHLNETKEIKIPINEDREEYYLPSLLRNFYKIFLSNVGKSKEKYDIWHHYFPELLKITGKSLTAKNAEINEIIMQSFLDEIERRRKENPEAKYDSELSSISEGLFPNVHPPFWSVISMFIKDQHSPQEVIERFINYGRLYGGSTSLMMVSGNLSDKKRGKLWQQQENEGIKSTLDLIFYFNFGKLFNKSYTDICLKYIDEFAIEDDKDGYRLSRKNTIREYIKIVTDKYTELYKLPTGEKSKPK
jgi:hypothetical protein